jgi:hypothetical protein
MLCWHRSFRIRNPGIVTIRRIFHPQTASTRPQIIATVAVHSENGVNGYSARNYQFMEEESTRGIVIQLGIASLWTRIPPEE